MDGPGRRIAMLAAYGVLTGLGEAAVVLLVVALAAGAGGGHGLPLVEWLPSSTWALAGIALGVIALLAVVHVAAAWTRAGIAADAQRSMQTRLLQAFLHAPWARQTAARTGDLQDLMTVKTGVLAYGTQEAASAVTTVVSLAVLIGAALAVSPWTAGGLLVAAVIVILAGRPFRAWRRRMANSRVASASALAMEVTETTLAARDFRVFGVTDFARARLARRVDESARLLRAVRFSAQASGPVTRDATLLVLVLVLAVVVSGGGTALPELGASVILVLRALGSAQAVAGLGHQLDERLANVRAVQERLDDWRPPVATGSRACPPVDRIELTGVSFSYGSGAPAVAGLTLELARGEQLGVIGPTGAGKSTVAAILLGLLVPQEGQVLVGGVPLEQIDPSAWHSRTAWVGQEPQLLTGTVAENIRFLRPDVDDELVERAAYAAGLGPELDAWPLRLDHDVGVAGAAVSGGQRQRIALARALAGEPDLLVLDEPTSALDAHSEAAIRGTLHALRGSAIVVVIAHRLSTIHGCDRVAIVEGGRLARIGPPDELSTSDGYFREALALANPEGR